MLRSSEGQTERAGSEWEWLGDSRNHVTAQRTQTSVFHFPLQRIFPEKSEAEVVPHEEEKEEGLLDVVVGQRFTCRVCGCEFETLAQQHEHFKSPLHVLNLKRNLAGLSTIDRESDIAEVEEDIDDDMTADGDIEIVNINNYYEHDSHDSSLDYHNTLFDEGYVRKFNHKSNGPVVVYRRNGLNWEFSLSKVLYDSFSGANDSSKVINPWGVAKNILRTFNGGDKLHTCVLILQSGKFAGGVFEGEKCIAHKVFRRYTVRAKAGGGQSNFDNNGRKAKSAGATLRRYGEQALRDDIQSLLQSWLPYLQSCVAIFTHIPKTMKNYIFSEELSAKEIHRSDRRICAIPFMIKAPTFEEMKAAHKRCMMVEFSPVTESGSDCHEQLQSIDEDESVESNDENDKPSETRNDNDDLNANLEENDTSILNSHVPDDIYSSLVSLRTAVEDGDEKILNENLEQLESICLKYESASFQWLSMPHSLEGMETLLHKASEGKPVNSYASLSCD